MTDSPLWSINQYYFFVIIKFTNFVCSSTSALILSIPVKYLLILNPDGCKIIFLPIPTQWRNTLNDFLL